MKYAIIMILGLMITDPLKISRINSLKSEAKKAFQSGDYKGAAEKYTYLADSLGIKEDEVLLNLAHAYYLQKDTANAFTKYQPLAQSIKGEIASKANNQMGLITNLRGKSEEALSYFKQAIKGDPSNEDARYNYEMLKKKLDAKKKEDEKNNKDKKDEKKNQEPSEFAKKLKAQADKLVAEKKYRQAFNLMMDGLKKDQTVSTYQEYIDRIKVIVGINE